MNLSVAAGGEGATCAALDFFRMPGRSGGVASNGSPLARQAANDPELPPRALHASHIHICNEAYGVTFVLTRAMRFRKPRHELSSCAKARMWWAERGVFKSGKRWLLTLHHQQWMPARRSGANQACCKVSDDQRSSAEHESDFHKSPFLSGRIQRQRFQSATAHKHKATPAKTAPHPTHVITLSRRDRSAG